MAMTLATVDHGIPEGIDEINVRFSRHLANDFLAMLNMNKVRDAYGCLLVFRWYVYDNGDAVLETTMYTPGHEPIVVS